MGRAEDLYSQINTIDDVHKIVADATSEDLFLEFKNVTGMGVCGKFQDADRNNFAKAISGFGNSEGGVIVWGIDCRNTPKGDVARKECPIQMPARFLSYLEGAVSGCTVPAHQGVLHKEIHNDDGTGFVITLISKSFLRPHQCLRDLHYYMRAGSSFLPVPHGILSGMFGSASPPEIFCMWLTAPIAAPIQSVSTSFSFMLCQTGPGVCSNVYSTIELWTPGPNCEISAEPQNDPRWAIQKGFDSMWVFALKNEYRLMPHAATPLLHVRAILQPPFTSSFSYRFYFGHESSPTHLIENAVSPVELSVYFDQNWRNKEGDEVSRSLANLLIGCRQVSNSLGFDRLNK
jgi:hypothetical protein